MRRQYALPNNAHFNGTYPYTGYVLGGPDLALDVLNTAFYYGMRRYPYSRDLAKNPLTFKHVANHVALPAVPPPAFGAGGADNAEVHNTGEVWGSRLWQCYSNLLNDTAQPTIIEARDALLAVMSVRSLEDETLCLQGFALRGAGPGAVAPDRFSQDNTGVVESFSMGGIRFVSVTLSDRPLHCDADDVLDNGETGTLTVTLQNMGPATLSTTTGTVVSSDAHIQFPSTGALIFPASAPGQTVSVSVPVKLVGAVGREGTDFTIAFTAPGLPALPAPSVASFALNFDVNPGQSATDDVESAHTVWNPAYKNPGAALWHICQRRQRQHRVRDRPDTPARDSGAGAAGVGARAPQPFAGRAGVGRDGGTWAPALGARPRVCAPRVPMAWQRSVHDQQDGRNTEGGRRKAKRQQEGD